MRKGLRNEYNQMSLQKEEAQDFEEKKKLTRSALTLLSMAPIPLRAGQEQQQKRRRHLKEIDNSITEEERLGKVGQEEKIS